MSSQVFFSAFSLAASQIVGIGPQNAFVLRQGLARQHVLTIVLICIACDVLLISLGVFGVGRLLASLPSLTSLLVWCGAGLMLWLSYQSFHAAFVGKALQLQQDARLCRNGVIRNLLLVTLLNPYVWLDTVVLIGSMSVMHGAQGRLPFMLGALAASVMWFFTVGFGAGRLAPWFQRPGSWRLLDIAIGSIMLLTAGMLLGRSGAI
ncbi:LysE/ArgO family amino acid transporter [Vogesella sp. GCM10023246]|uniref:LysE family transporter n=1 Tax=Vogesella oryzagri TaxID=3160864 RepID=A0ABV1M552_9NEIS